MKKTLIPFSATHQFSSLVDDYLSGDSKLRPFYHLAPEPGSFEEAISKRKTFPGNRKVLHNCLLKQYGMFSGYDTSSSEKVKNSINNLLDERTFTVTTGHQLNLFTGPLYSIYKIITTIKLTEELAKLHSEFHFVPVFWMASEDHDFAEINHAHIYGKTINWNRDAKGPAGRLKLDGIISVMDEFKLIAGDQPELIALFEDAYLSSGTLALATRKIIHALFSKYGLVVIDGDDKELKALFVDEMKSDLLHHVAYQEVNATAERLVENYKVQVRPREINLFYVEDNLRERIVKEDGFFKVLNTELKFTQDELLTELHKYPEKFSPNVVMRPLYQEKILPNLAYIGGPGELNYWLEYKSFFEASGIPFPMLILRNCMMILDNPTWNRLIKMGLSINDIFQSTDFLVLKILESSSNIHVGTEEYAAIIQKTFNALSEQLNKLDSSLVSAVESERQKALNGIKTIEEKGRRALKKKNETLVNQLKSLKEKLFPQGNLQERRDNFIPFYISFGPGFLDEIHKNTDPFVKEFIVLVDEK